MASSIYLAKKNLRLSGYMDLIFAGAWATLILIFAIYHFGYLIPNRYSVSTLSSQATTSGKVAGIVAKEGYIKLFDVELFQFLFIRFKLWVLVITLWTITLICFVGKILLGFFSLFQFFKHKSIQHIFASLAVIFLPCMGGIIAINTYKATTSTIAPRYVASHSFLRFKFRKFWEVEQDESSTRQQ